MNSAAFFAPLRSFSLKRYLPLLVLINPGKLIWPSLAAFLAGIGVGWALFQFAGFPTWSITLITILALLPVGIIKWKEDRRQFGLTAMLVSILLIAQGGHSIEHIVQWAQYYILNLPARQSNGLLSAANSEWVHFTWNWLVLICVVALIRNGVNNIWVYVLLGVATTHTFEHSYTFIRYLVVLNDLKQMGVTTVTAQGLPGIIGRDGWLARSEITRGTFLSTLPGLTTAIRLDVHFWWNLIEMTFLVLAGHVFMRDYFLGGKTSQKK